MNKDANCTDYMTCEYYTCMAVHDHGQWRSQRGCSGGWSTPLCPGYKAYTINV